MQAPDVRLKVAYRDVRVTRAGLWSIRQKASQPPALAFAMAILHRYRGHEAHWARLGFAFEQSRRPVLLRSVYYHMQIRLAPRLDLTLIRPTFHTRETVHTGAVEAGWVISGRRSETAAQPAPLWQMPLRWQSTWQTVSERPLVRLVRRVQRQTQVETVATVRLVQRLLTRGERRETIARPGPPRRTPPGRTTVPRWDEEGPVHAPLVRLARPRFEDDGGPKGSVSIVQAVPRVVQRRAAVAPDPGRTSPGTETPMTMGQAFVRPGAGVGARATGPPPVDVNRLTDQVMQTIDRRILAYRERRGRV